MKTLLSLLVVAITLITSGCATHKANSEKATKARIAGWGEVIDPNSDCKVLGGKGELLISVPGTNGPHDLAAEIGMTNAPRVLQTVEGDFLMEVTVDGRFAPGEESSLPGRTGYNGAGLVIMSDPQNVVTLARAVLQHETGAPMHYANFEIRSNGKVAELGDANHFPLPEKGPVLLRLERRGQTIAAAFSLDGTQWQSLPPKVIPADWPKKLQAGVVAISTSTDEFNPRFSVLKRWHLKPGAK